MSKYFEVLNLTKEERLARLDEFGREYMVAVLSASKDKDTKRKRYWRLRKAIEVTPCLRKDTSERRLEAHL